MIFSVDEFNNLKPADKLRKINEQLKKDKEARGVNFDKLFPGINGKSYG